MVICFVLELLDKNISWLIIFLAYWSVWRVLMKVQYVKLLLDPVILD